MYPHSHLSSQSASRHYAKFCNTFLAIHFAYKSTDRSPVHVQQFLLKIETKTIPIW